MKVFIASLVGLVTFGTSGYSQSITPSFSGLYLEYGNGSGNTKTATFLDESNGWEFGTLNQGNGSFRFSGAQWQNDVDLLDAKELDVRFPGDGSINPGLYVIGGDWNSIGFSANFAELSGVTSTGGHAFDSLLTDFTQVNILEARVVGADKSGEPSNSDVVVGSAVDFLFVATGNDREINLVEDQYIYGSFRDNSIHSFNTAVTVVPEPTTYVSVAALLLGGMVLVRRVKQRHSVA